MMNINLIRRLIIEKLCERNTYTLALVVGTLINLYGQLMVPWFRGVENPSLVLVSHFHNHPGLTICSIFLAFAFPLCVGIYSAVSTRYKNRRTESVADFPDSKPDPVFRVSRDGRIIEAGSSTRDFFDHYQIQHAESILGNEIWDKIKSGIASDLIGKCQFEPNNTAYIVKYASTHDDNVNIYLTKI